MAAAAGRDARAPEQAQAAAAAAERDVRGPEQAQAAVAAAGRDARAPEQAQATSSAERCRRSPWVVGIAIGLVLMVLVNLAFIYIAVRDADQIVPSYHLEHR